MYFCGLSQTLISVGEGIIDFKLLVFQIEHFLLSVLLIRFSID